jgi:hypothetical protein
MNFLESVPAVRRIETDRDDLFAVDIVGHVTSADFENLFGLLEAACALHDHIDVMVRFVDHDGIDWSEISMETLEAAQAQVAAHVTRCAIVGEMDWASRIRQWLSRPSSTEFRHFPETDEQSAWDWLKAARTGPEAAPLKARKG